MASVRSQKLREGVAGLGVAASVGPDEALALGPFDVALELIGGASFPGVLSALAISGRIVVIGVGGGAQVQLDLLTLMHKRGRISASTLRGRSIFDKAAVATKVEAHVLPLLADRRVRVPVEATFPMTRRRRVRPIRGRGEAREDRPRRRPGARLEGRRGPGAPRRRPRTARGQPVRPERRDRRARLEAARRRRQEPVPVPAVEIRRGS